MRYPSLIWAGILFLQDYCKYTLNIIECARPRALIRQKKLFFDSFDYLHCADSLKKYSLDSSIFESSVFRCKHEDTACYFFAQKCRP